MASGDDQLKAVTVDSKSPAAPAIGVKAALGAPVPASTKRWHAAALALLALLLGGAIAAAIIVPVAKDKWKNNSSSSRSRAASLAGSSDTSAGSSSESMSGQVREYYIAAERIQWNYTPLGKNNCSGKAFTGAEVPGPNNTYWKAVFRQYTDGTFKVLKARSAEEEHMGYLGPVLRAEAGDTVEVVLRNLLPFPINIEPAGVAYTPPTLANPGDTVTYIWKTSEDSVESGTTSQMWMYRSTVDPVTHTNAGLLGPLVVTQKGQAESDGRPKDVDQEVFTFMHVVEEDAVPEGLSEESVEFLEEGEDDAGRRKLMAEEEEPAGKLPKVHAINGYMFCNQPGMAMKKGDRVRWYVAGLGNEVDAHVAHWHGLTLDHNGHRMDSIRLLPGVTATLDTTTDSPGIWLLHCHINSHMASGMTTFFHVSGDAVDTSAKVEGKTRKYYIAAELREWDYAPQGGDLCHGGKTPKPFQDLTFVESGPGRIGRKYLKALYVEYTDDTFTTRKNRTADEQHLGFVGPIIRAEVGDKIEVVFKNKVPGHTFSIHPHGVLYAKDGEGSPYNDGTPASLKGDDGVGPGQNYTYTWLVPDRAGPSTADKSSVFWMYHSHVDETMDTYAGLFGGIIVTRQGYAQDNGRPKDVDRELVLMFYVTDETKSALYPENAEKYLKISGTPGKGGLVKEARGTLQSGGLAEMQEKILQKIFAKQLVNGSVPEEVAGGYGESNLMHNINGYMYCNLPNLETEVFSRVRIYAMSLGDLEDVHAPAIYGSRLIVDGGAQQAVQELAGSMLTADALPSGPGNFMFQCQVNDHVAAGMRALLKVTGSTDSLKSLSNGITRRYFIAAEEGEWDYAPLGYDGCSGEKFTPEQQVFTKTTANTLGSKYLKARYVEYTDDTFTKEVAQAGTLGLLGPLMKANAGDVIEIVFKNKLNSTRASLKFTGGLLPLSMERLAAGQKLPDLPAAPSTIKTVEEYDGRRRLAADTATNATNTTSASTTVTAKTAANAANTAATKTTAPTNAASKTNASKTTTAASTKATAATATKPTANVSTTTTKSTANTTSKAAASSKPSTIEGIDEVTEELQEGLNPGGMALYTWIVPPNAGPGSSDDIGLVAYTYQSAVDEIAHMYAGMMGVIVVGNEGTFPAAASSSSNSSSTDDSVTVSSAAASSSSSSSSAASPKSSSSPEYDGRRKLHSSASVDDAKFITPLMFMYFDENQSPYLERNVKAQAAAAKLKAIKTDSPEFAESNLMHGVNGRVYCNLPALKLKEGQKGIVVLAAMGSEEIHTPTFEGVDVHVGNRNVMATALLPSVTQVATITGKEAGNWRAYCTVTDHFAAGMMARLVVSEPATVESDAGSPSSAAASPPYDGRRLLRAL